MDVNSYLTAAMNDDGTTVTLHLLSGFPADLQLPDGSGGQISLLHLVTFRGLDGSTEALLKGGANPDIRDSGGMPPIKMAIAEGRARAVELLLDHGANPNGRLAGGETPLHVAYMNDHSGIADLLLSRGADPEAQNDQGITPRQVAAYRGMKMGGWEASRPASVVDAMSGMSEENLLNLFTLLPTMVEARLQAGEITPARKLKLDGLLKDFEDAMSLPLEVRSTRMKEIAGELLAIMGTSEAM